MSDAPSAEYILTPPTLTDRQQQKLRLNAKGALVASMEDAAGNSAPAGTATAPIYIAGSGVTASATFTPTNTAYSANDIMDVAQQFAFTFSDGSAVPAGSLIRILTVILKIDQTALQASEGAYTLQGFSVTPPSALADNAAWTLASGDLPSYRGSISLGTPVDLGAACYIKTPLVDIDIKLTTSSLWGNLQTLAGFTPTAVARQVFLYGVVL